MAEASGKRRVFGSVNRQPYAGGTLSRICVMLETLKRPRAWSSPEPSLPAVSEIKRGAISGHHGRHGQLTFLVEPHPATSLTCI